MKLGRWAFVLCVVALAGVTVAPGAIFAEERDLSGTWVLDQSDYAKRLAVRLQRVFERHPVEPKLSAERLRAEAAAQSRATAFGMSLQLSFRSDSTFDAEWTGREQWGSRPTLSVSGTWRIDNTKLLLLVEVRKGAVSLQWLLKGEHVCKFDGVLPLLPALPHAKEVPLRLRRATAAEAAFLPATPAERSAQVRAKLPAPSKAGALVFEGEIFGAMGGSAGAFGTMRVAAEPSTYEGRPAWKVTERRIAVVPGDSKEVTAYLAQDLTLLHQTTRSPGEPDEISTVERMEDGYSFANPWQEPQTVKVDGAVRPLIEVVGYLLFLQACPDLALTYELPVVGRNAIRTERLIVTGPGSTPRHGSGRPVSTWNANTASIQICLDPADRHPILIRAGGILIAEPGVVSLYDFLDIPIPAQEPAHAASAFTLAVLRKDRKALEELLDFPALHEEARARGFKGPIETFREELFAVLKRRRDDLLPAEAWGIEKMLTKVRRREPEGDAVRVTLFPPCEDYEVLVARTEDRFRVIGMHECILAETRCCGDEWKDATRPEPVVDGARFWFHRRNLHNPRGMAAFEAAHALANTGELGIPVLFEALLKEPDPRIRNRADARIDSVLAGLGLPILRPLLDAHEQGDARERAILAKVAAEFHRGSPMPPAEEAAAYVPALRRALTVWPEMQPFLLYALELIGPRAAEAIPDVEALRASAKGRGSFIKRALRSLRECELVIPVAARPPVPEPKVEDGAPRLSSRRASVRIFRSASDSRTAARPTVRDDRLDRIRAVGEVKPGTYVVVIRESGYPPVVLNDVTLGPGVHTLPAIRIVEGCAVHVRIQVPKGVPFRRGRASVKYLGAPSYAQDARLKEEDREATLHGLGPGRFLFTFWADATRRGNVHEQELELDGTTDVRLEVEIK